jgi:hypothetical protein
MKKARVYICIKHIFNLNNDDAPPMGNTRRFLMQTIKIIKVPMGAYLDTKTTAFKIVDLNNKDIIDLDVGNMFYWKKRDAIKYINNSNQLKLKNKRGI